MLKRLSELINQAEICLENPGLSEGTIEDYRHSAFHPLERRLDTKEYVDSAAILSQEEFFWEQYEKGQISRHTLNWRIRGIRILAEVYETGTFAWKVFSKKEKAGLPEPFYSALQSFLFTKECGKKHKSCIESICRRFLLGVVGSGGENFDGISPEHVRSFMVGISGCLPLRGAGITMSSRVFHRKRHLLVAVSGLRTGDIATLRLRDIDWKRNEIRLVQGKTAEPLVLPIPKPVLQAVADYILNGRPHTASDRVFVRHLAPSDFWLMHYSLNNDLYYKSFPSFGC